LVEKKEGGKKRRVVIPISLGKEKISLKPKKKSGGSPGGKKVSKTTNIFGNVAKKGNSRRGKMPSFPKAVLKKRGVYLLKKNKKRKEKGRLKEHRHLTKGKGESMARKKRKEKGSVRNSFAHFFSPDKKNRS